MQTILSLPGPGTFSFRDWSVRPPAFARMSAEEAFSRTFDGPQQAVIYDIPSLDVQPRLSKRGAGLLLERGVEINVHWVFADVDLLDEKLCHRPWYGPEEVSATYAWLQADDLCRRAFWYQTPRGYRLVWRLSEPVPLQYATVLLQTWISLLRAKGMTVDKASDKWYYPWLLPKATNIGDKAPRQLLTSNWHEMVDVHPSEIVQNWGEPEYFPTGAFDEIVRTSIPLTPELKRKLDPLRARDESLYVALHTGAPLAPEGSRQHALARTVGLLATYVSSDANEVCALILPSCLAAGLDEDQVWGACERICQLEQSSQSDIAEYVALMQPTTPALDALPPVQPAPAEGPRPVSVPHDIGTRLIVQYGAQYWIWSQWTGNYVGPLHSSSVLSALRQNCPDYAQLFKTSGKAVGLRPLTELLVHHATVVEQLFFDGGHTCAGDRVYLDASGKFTLSLRTWRQRSELSPQYHPHVDEWFRRYVKDPVDYPRLLDWLSAYPLTDRPLCVLYLEGPRGAGKSLLLNALCSIYQSPAVPVTFSSLLKSQFNAEMLATPMIAIEEGVHSEDASRLLRQLIGAHSVVIQKKYADALALRGCPRLMICANNRSALPLSDLLSTQDYEAIVERLGHIEVGINSEPYLEWLQSCGYDMNRMTHDVAEHVLWLSHNHVRQSPGGRFLVRGWESPLHQEVTTLNGRNGDIVELLALLTCVEDNGVDHHMIRKAVGFFEGTMRVNASGLRPLWRVVRGDTNDIPTVREIGSVLKSLALPTTSRHARLWGSTASPRAWIIDAERIMQAAEALLLEPDLLRNKVEASKNRTEAS